MNCSGSRTCQGLLLPLGLSWRKPVGAAEISSSRCPDRAPRGQTGSARATRALYCPRELAGVDVRPGPGAFPPERVRRPLETCCTRARGITRVSIRRRGVAWRRQKLPTIPSAERLPQERRCTVRCGASGVLSQRPHRVCHGVHCPGSAGSSPKPASTRTPAPFVRRRPVPGPSRCGNLLQVPQSRLSSAPGLQKQTRLPSPWRHPGWIPALPVAWGDADRNRSRAVSNHDQGTSGLCGGPWPRGKVNRACGDLAQPIAPALGSGWERC